MLKVIILSFLEYCQLFLKDSLAENLFLEMILLYLNRKACVQRRCGSRYLTSNTTGNELIMHNWLLPNRTTVTSNILQRANINRSDAGIYNCTALSTAGKKTLTAFTTTTRTVFCKCTINMFFICA